MSTNLINLRLSQNIDQSITSGIYGIITENSDAIITNNYSTGNKATIAGFKNSNLSLFNNIINNSNFISIVRL